MLNLMTLKDKQKKEGNNSNKTTAAYLRLQKDLSELHLPDNISINFPEGSEKVLNFEIIIVPKEGFHRYRLFPYRYICCPSRGGRFVFSFRIPQGYPHDPPKVKCLTKVFHPNIDLDGNVCLNILREDWRPVLSIISIVHGLHFVLLTPNSEDPLNKVAAQMMVKSERQFDLQVQRGIHHGTHIEGNYFPACAQ